MNEALEHQSLLHGVQPARCNRPWEFMDGTDFVRSCPVCQALVYRVDGEDDDHVLQLVTSSEPTEIVAKPLYESFRLARRTKKHKQKLKFYRRTDGTLMLTPGWCSYAVKCKFWGLVPYLLIVINIGLFQTSIDALRAVIWLTLLLILLFDQRRSPETNRHPFIQSFVLAAIVAGLLKAPMEALSSIHIVEVLVKGIVLGFIPLSVWLATTNAIRFCIPQLTKGKDRLVEQAAPFDGP